jgi:hypothetical protein
LTPQPDSIDVVANPAFVAGIEDLPIGDLRERWRLAGSVLTDVSASLEWTEVQLDDLAPADGRHATDHDDAAGAPTDRSEPQERVDMLRRPVADITRDRDIVRRVYDLLGDEIGRRYRLGPTSVDEMLQV